MDFGGLITILILVFVCSSITKNAKKAQKNRPGQQATPDQRQAMPDQRQATPDQQQASGRQAPPAMPRKPSVDPHEPSGAPLPENIRRKAASPAQPSGAPRGPRLPQEILEMFGMDEEDVGEIREMFGMGRTPRPAPAGPKSAPVPASSAEGMSRADPSGCVGGSLPHAHEQGGRALRPKDRPAEATRVETLGSVRAGLTAQDMRRALVTAEILARPVSLRPRGYRL